MARHGLGTGHTWQGQGGRKKEISGELEESKGAISLLDRPQDIHKAQHCE